MGQFDNSSSRLYFAVGMLRLGLLLLVGLTTSPAWAQTSEGADKKRIDPFEVARKTPLDEKTSNLEKLLSKQRSDVSRTAGFLREARADKDLVRANCLEQKLKLLSALLKLSEASAQKLVEAVANRNDDMVDQSYAKLLIASQRSGAIAAEANQCVGATAVFSGTTEITVNQDEAIGAADPTSSVIPPPVVNTPPVSSSF
ncbi:MAG: hypothetical protein AAGD10_03185 [Myxococcota bacterium]